LRLIVGVGNPGRRYSDTKHNVGFRFLDYFASLNKLVFQASTHDYHFIKGSFKNFPFVLLKPTNYVNLSGVAVLQAIGEYNLETENVLVVVDDVNLPLGKIRIRKSGGDGGHNGLSSIIYSLNSNQFPRIRIGVGNDFDKGQMADYVLGKFTKQEKVYIDRSFDRCKSLVEEFIVGGAKNMLDALSKESNNLEKSQGNNLNL
jgi:PTH1 family peptidyl-tRNA hydrolase